MGSEHIGGFEAKRRLEALGYSFVKFEVGSNQHVWRCLDETGSVAAESQTMGRAMSLAIEALGGL